MKTKFILSSIVMFLTTFNTLSLAEEGFNLLATMSGDSVGDQFCNVAGVGDVNGDGYPDILVGATGGSFGAPVGRYAKLYFGGAPFDTVADLIFRDDKISSLFGYSIAGKGDVNGDGYPDIVIGAPDSWVGPSYPDRSITGAGAAYVYFGGQDMDTIPDLELVVGDWDEQVGWYYQFGWSVTIAGDINNDGFDDLVIGAPEDDYDAHGRVYIFFGGSDMDTEYDVLLEGEDHHDNLGYSIAGTGDINCDGFDDVLIGTPQSLSDSPGKAYLINGGNEIMLSDATVFIGDSATYYFGRVVAGLGDINGDNCPDIGIMASNYFRIFSGMDKSILMEISYGNEWHGNFEYLAGGDVNDDSYQDILIGLAQAERQYAGEFRVYLGASNTDTIPDYSIEGKTAHYYFGKSIASLGDINNDGNEDIVVGEEGQQSQGASVAIGKVYIYSYGKPDKIKEGSSLPKDFRLYQNHPNPFNFATKINYYLPTSCNLKLTVYDITGCEIAILIDKYQPKGRYSVCWDATQYSSGIYFYRLMNENEILDTKKMLLVK